VGGSWRLLVVPCRVEATREGDGERVQCRLPPVHPSFLGGAGRVKGTRHEVQTLQRGLIGREVTTGPHSAGDVDDKNKIEKLARFPEQALRPVWRQLQ